jgi:putative hydrolase of the HAD superfamily
MYQIKRGSLLAKINAVIFDLDNVLFNERDYINAAYRNIASFLSKRHHLQEAQVYQKLLNDLQTKTSLYPRLFNDAIADLGLDQAVLPEILKIYGTVTAKLELASGAEHLLETLRKQEIRLGLVTNGNVETQRNKVQLLGIEKYFDAVFYARELGKENEKPNPEVYRIILNALHSKPDAAICIGDNPYTDFYGAKKLGLRTVRLIAGEFKNVRLSKEYEADLEVRNLEEFYTTIEQSN